MQFVAIGIILLAVAIAIPSAVDLSSGVPLTKKHITAQSVAFMLLMTGFILIGASASHSN